jgi:prepilin-type N-terminal cleavage/methylation domain-containing protein
VRTSRTSRRGFTLLELLMSVALIAMVLGSSLAMTLRGRDAYVATALQAVADGKARHALQRMAKELENADADNLLADPGIAGGNAIEFTPVVDVVGGVPILGNPIRIQRNPAPNDPDDGVDNDGNGVVDEGVIVLIRAIGTPDQTTAVLCTGVRELLEGEIANGADDNGNGLTDEAGLSLRRAGQLVTIRISIEQPGSGGSTTIGTLETSVTLRN